jgi:hypothetical protein
MKTGKLICQGCKGSGVNPFNSGGYCVCPKGTAKKAEEDEQYEHYMDTLHNKKVRP